VVFVVAVFVKEKHKGDILHSNPILGSDIIDPTTDALTRFGRQSLNTAL
jgi:hypothetical protein